MQLVLQGAVSFILVIWAAGMTFLVLKLQNHYQNLTRDVSGKNLQEILMQILEDQKQIKKDLATLAVRCDKIEEEQVFALNKIGLIRFNPFKDTGGDQSFIISLLNKENTGVVLSGLYSRLGTRWYAKKVKNGKAVEHELSDDEKKAITTATFS
jgi:hypothetical protein